MATRKEIREFVAKVLSGHRFTPKEKDWIEIGAVTDSQAEDIRSKTGKNLSGHTRIIDRSYVRKVMKDHGNAASEKSRGNVAVTPEDFELIPEIVSRGTIKEGLTLNNQGVPCITYSLLLDDMGTVIYVEAIRSGRDKLALQTMYKQRIRKKKAR